MTDKVKQTISFILQPKAIFLGVAIFLLIYVADMERRFQEIVGCYDCGWFSRQALYLLIAAMCLLVNRFWSVMISLLLSVKVIYSIGYVAFWNTNVTEAHGGWRILKESLRWSYQSHPEFFIEIMLAVLIGLYATSFIWQRIYRKYLLETHGI